MTWTAEPSVTSAARIGVPSGSCARRVPSFHMVWLRRATGLPASGSGSESNGARPRNSTIPGASEATTAAIIELRTIARRPKPDSSLASANA